MDRTERSFRELVDELPDLVCHLAPDGTLLYVNRAYADYFGLDQESLIGRCFLELVPDDVKDVAQRDLELIAELTPERPVRSSEHRGGDTVGGQRWQHWVDKAIFDADGDLIGLLSIGRDVTDRRLLEQQVQYHARHDSLTGLVNRRCTLETLDIALHRAAGGDPVGLLYIDLDDFKSVNDRFGHRAGDRMLSEVAQALHGAVRLTDAVGRLGGDEFVVVCCPVHHLRELDEVADRIGQRLAGMTRPISASIGAVMFELGETVDELLHRADEAMYRVKQRRHRRNAG